MSIVFSILTSDPNLLACELHRLKGSVRLGVAEGEGPRHNAVGVGSYADDTVLMHRYPSSAMPADVTELTHYGKSDALLYHGRSLPVGMSLEDNTQPFRFRRWLFAHGGELEGYRGFKQRLWEELPDHLKRHVRGETDSEVAFALFLKLLRATGRTDDRGLEPKRALAVLADTAKHLDELARGSAPEKRSGVNLIATNEELLVACRLGPAPLYYRELTGRATCELCELDPSSPQDEPKVRAHERCRSVAVASHLSARAGSGGGSGGSEAGWIELPESHGLAIGEHRDLVIQAL